MDRLYHSPEQFISDFRQILAEGKKRIGLLLGAGIAQAVRIPVEPTNEAGVCETKPILPMISDLTLQVLSELSEQSTCVRIVQDRLKVENPDREPTIEDVLSLARLLSKVLGRWEFERMGGGDFGKLAQNICASIGKIVGVDLPPGQNAITRLVTWIGGTPREHPVEIFTTNYDFLLEEAFENASYPYFDGFSGNRWPFFDAASVAENNLPARWTRLWKLHGSLGWQWYNDRVVHGRGKDAAALIYPDHLKYELTSKMPYLALFERLRAFLMTPDSVLVACGFSFADAHVSSVIEEALAANRHSAVFAFQFRQLKDEAAATTLAKKRSNMSVLAYDGGVLHATEANWKVGEPKNDHWSEIRQAFWGTRSEEGPPGLLLGDFGRFAGFLAAINTRQSLPQQRPVHGPGEILAEPAPASDNTGR